MKKVIRLTESDLTRIVKRIIKESEDDMGPLSEFTNEELEEIKYKVIRYLQPGFFDEWEAENYLLYSVSGGNKHLYNSLVGWLEQNGVESYHLKKIK